ncbi:MAG TPA: hypothetical protein VK576_04360 [Thermoleophilia bacterium]|nr:hypothetical protein [Thermoleophilia bacterium]
MPLADAQSFAAGSIEVLIWWVIVSPVTLLAATALTGRRLGLRLTLVALVTVPTLLLLAPIAVLHAGAGGVAAKAAVAAGLVTLVLAAAGLATVRRAPVAADRRASWALVCGLVTGLVGSLALLATFVFA